MMENPTTRPSADAVDPFGPRRGARESLIDQDCFFEGTFRTPGNMRIEGTYEGVIECQGTLLIAESGRVNARIVAGNLTVAGQLQGEALCESRFELLQSGKVHGTIAAKTTIVHDGAFFEGEIRMGEQRAESVARPLSPPQPAATSARAGSGSSPINDMTPTLPLRRRPAPEDDGAQAASVPEEHPQTSEASESVDSAPQPKTNGRNQQSAGRNAVPNRSAETQ